MFFNVELEEKIEAKSVTLSDEEDMASGPFIIVDTAALPQLIIWLVIFENSRDLTSFLVLARAACT